MSGAAESFATELGRVSKRGYAQLRGLRPADRDDAIAAAMLACWENRAAFDQHKQPLADWFGDALRDSVRHIKRSSRSKSYASMKLNEIAGIDSTSQSAEAMIAAEQLVKRLTDREQRVASLLARGYSLSDIANTLRMPHSELKKVTRKLKKMSDGSLNTGSLRAPYAPPPDSDHRDRELAPIDHAIEAMLRHPANSTADCVPCWKCMYFEGWCPAHYHLPTLGDPEIQAAVAATEARKIQIGSGERV